MQDIRKAKVTVEKVFRGIIAIKPIEILSTSYKADYQLIPKDQEKNFVPSTDSNAKRELKILPTTTDFPPLLADLIRKETGNASPKLKLVVPSRRESYYRLATAGETPTEELPARMGLGKPSSPNLFKNLSITEKN